MRFRAFAVIAVFFSIGFWFLNGRVLASDTEDGWRILRDTTTNALKFLWFPTSGASPSSMTLTTNGNVGIGTDNPATKLQLVNGNFNILTGAALFDIQGTSGRNLMGSSGHLKIAFDSNNDESDRGFFIGHDSLDFQSALFTILENGNTGVGTVSPATAFHITNAANNQQLRVSDAGIADSNQGRMEIGYDAVSSLGRIQAWKDGAGALPITINPGGGRVGIGTITPSSILHIHNNTPRILLFDYDSAIGSTNPAWGVRAESSGNFKIQSTIDYSGYSDRMTIDKDGNVGIGTTNIDYKLEVSGSAGKSGGGSWSDSSDFRIKKNITNYDNALSKLLKLRGVNFNWINPEDHNGQTGVQGGFIAQEVEKIFPNWLENINPAGSDAKLVGSGEKIKSLTLPFEFNAVVVESIKEQQRQIDQQANEIEYLKQEIQNLKQQIAR